ncbi:MAG: DUF2339 domain-containing protein [Bryobacterales bacterium]|nr:DUF2339 domain-containing protein [Bryobacterales bacterium]
MEAILYLILLGFGIVLLVIVRRTQKTAGHNRSRASHLEAELQATRSALVNRINVLEKQVTDLQAGRAVETPPEPEQPAPGQALLPESAPATVDSPGESSTAGPEVAPPTPPPQPAAPSAPPRSPGEPPPLAQLSRRIDWEQWIGIKGAAVLGGIVLALAAVMFLRYAIEYGLIPPTVRVAIGLATGIAAIAVSERLRGREYVTTANALAFGGIVVLYVSVWAARVLYGLVPLSLGFLLMILVTVACGALAWRHRAREIALLGPIGGFATPILMSTGHDDPIGLFGYVLLLDVGLLWLARVRRWPWLMILALFGTFFYEALWVLFRMGPDRTEIGLGVLVLFGLFFSLALGLRKPKEITSEQDAMERLVQLAGAWAPFGLALYFAARADLGDHLYPVAALMLVLSIAAGWLGRTERMPQLPAGAAAGCVAVVMAWLLRTDFTTALAWEASVVCIALTGAFHAFLELDKRRPVEPGQITGAKPAVITSLGFLGLLALVAMRVTGTPLWPWMAGWTALAGMAFRQAGVSGRGLIQQAAGFGLALGFSLFFLTFHGSSSLPPDTLFFGLVVLAGLGLQIIAFRRKESRLRRSADWAAAAFAMTVLFLMLFESSAPGIEAWLYLAATITLGFLSVLSAARLKSGGLYFAVVALLSCNHFLWVESGIFGRGGREAALLSMASQLAVVIAFSYLPFLAGTSLLRRRWAWYGAALSGPAWFFPLRELFEEHFGDAAIGLLPVVLGAVSLGAVFMARRLGPLDDADRLRPLVWFSAVALGFASIAIPLQLDKEWITVGWALEGFAVITLWKRLDHPGLKYFGLVLLTAVTLRLVANPGLLDYYERSGLPIVNWLMYTYLIPAAALLGGLRHLREQEVERVRSWEENLYSGRRPLGAIACGMAAVAVVFTWINVTIFDFFAEGAALTISFERMAARDLTMSLAWALYALLLLGIGFKRDSEGLRWVSLAFLVLTIGKVFLHDLGELEDLYRVASLVGLALSLILVSLAYQRFVFSKRSMKEDS